MIVRALVVALLLIVPSLAHADVIGPVCWVLAGDGLFPEPFRLFFIVDPANPNVASVVGRTELDGTPVSGSAILGGAPPSVDMVLTVGPIDLGTAYLVSANFRLSDLGGSAVCQGVDSRGGCGTGKSGTWTPAPCP